jgi:hypothetical protein
MAKRFGISLPQSRQISTRRRFIFGNVIHVMIQISDIKIVGLYFLGDHRLICNLDYLFV